MPLLHRLASTASEGSEDSRFAHRHLARLLLESSPWTAALHLRSVLRVAPDDDGAHAMLGFCHAVQGNFRCAVAAYRRAGALAPRNPWYQHNLGHLLDRTLGSPREALSHLRQACELAPGEPVLRASLARCMEALRDGAAPAENGREPNGSAAGARRDLLLRHGRRPANGAAAPASRAATAPRRAGRAASSVERDVERILRTLCTGDAGRRATRACVLWRAFVRARRAQCSDAAASPAAVDYAITRLDATRGITQSRIAARYGTTSAALRRHFVLLRAALDLPA